MESHNWGNKGKPLGLAAAAICALGTLITSSIAQQPAAPAPAPASVPAAAPTQPAAPATTQAATTRPTVNAANPIEAGKYLIMVGGCHDCHTPGWMESHGQGVPEENYLIGLHIGFRGPWGTTYGSNLRAFATQFVEDDFVKVLRARTTRPPMPWSAVHAMSDQDLRAVYQYLKSLKPTGKAAPAYVPPGVEPTTPYFVLDPSVSPRAYIATTQPAAATAPAPAKP